ncbi:MAG: biotin/lipoyl-containing protein [Paeniglutamicibacter sp.]
MTSPMLGIFFRSPAPGEAPFVSVGDTVTADSVIGIIEVMKLMNPVHAGVAGTVSAIAAKDAEAVEYGQDLLFIAPEAS